VIHMAYKIKVKTNKENGNDGLWYDVIDTKYSRSKVVTKYFMDEQEAQEYAEKHMKVMKLNEDYVIEEVE